jgi:hypothetical protein
MKRNSYIGLISLIFFMGMMPSMAHAQTARQVLDRTSATLDVDGGVKASFAISMFTGTKFTGATSGSLDLKGNKFHAVTPQAIVWFDGKTEWTYMKNNDEVNVSTPTAAQLQQMNPYHFINIYKQGYSMKLIKTKLRKTPVYEVHLKAQSKSQELQQVLISVDKNSYQPLCVRMLRGKNKWTMLSISKFSKANLSDSEFRFNAKDFPKAEVIDLR